MAVAVCVVQRNAKGWSLAAHFQVTIESCKEGICFCSGAILTNDYTVLAWSVFPARTNLVPRKLADLDVERRGEVEGLRAVWETVPTTSLPPCRRI